MHVVIDKNRCRGVKPLAGFNPKIIKLFLLALLNRKDVVYKKDPKVIKMDKFGAAGICGSNDFIAVAFFLSLRSAGQTILRLCNADGVKVRPQVYLYHGS